MPISLASYGLKEGRRCRLAVMIEPLNPALHEGALAKGLTGIVGLSLFTLILS